MILGGKPVGLDSRAPSANFVAEPCAVIVHRGGGVPSVRTFSSERLLQISKSAILVAA